MGLIGVSGQFFLLTVLLLISISHGFAADTHPRAIQKLIWYPEVSLEVRLDQPIPAENKADIKKQLKADWYHSFKLQSPQKSGLTRSVKNCEAFFSALKDHMVPIKWSEFYYYVSFGLQCHAAQLIVTGLDAKYSYINDFKFNETIIDRFPPDLADLISDEMIARVRNDKSINNWRKAGKLTSIVVDNAHTAHTTSSMGSLQDIHLLGRGDFNNDGYEDILVMTNNSVVGGSHKSTGLFLLTRKSTDPMFELVKEYQAH